MTPPCGNFRRLPRRPEYGRWVRKFLTAVGAALLLTSLAGCFGPGPVKTPLPTPSVTPVFASDEEALAAAEAAYAAYLAVDDAVFADGGAQPERLATVATGDFLEESIAGYKDVQSKGWHSVGNSTIRSIELQAFDTASRGPGIVSAYVCDDVSAVDVLDSNGTSVVSPARPDNSLLEVIFDLDPNIGHLLISSHEIWGDGQC